MANMEIALKDLFRSAMSTAYPGLALPDVLVVAGKKFSDFQCNNAMGLAKLLSTQKPPVKKAPKAIGEELVANLPANTMIEKAETTDQGFINIRLSAAYLGEAVKTQLVQGIKPPPANAQKILVDFSSPNIAKEMHVGHLRSTIIGEALCRLFEFVGHDVERINHTGDWGTQFGMLILYLKERHPDFLEVPPPISDLVVFYRDAKKKFDEDPVFKEGARNEVVKLQAYDPICIKAWEMICDISRKEFDIIYKRLDITVKERGESFYNKMIPDVLQLLRDAKTIEESDGAEIIMSMEDKAASALTAKDIAKIIGTKFVKGKRDGTIEVAPAFEQGMRSIGVLNEEGMIALGKGGKDAKPLAKVDVQKDVDKIAKVTEALFKPKMEDAIAADLQAAGMLTVAEDPKATKVKVPRWAFPLIARKSDGGFTYDTTDLAAVHHRFQQAKHDRVVYVTDVGQFEHFKMVCQVATDVGWITDAQRWDHAGFGLVSGADGKKLKTRSGETVKLKDLLDEAVERSLAALKEREQGDAKQGHTEEDMVRLSKTIGLGAIKYFDLKQSRTTDYSFSFDKMLDMSGNTAVFLLYSYARMCSITRKAGVEDVMGLIPTTEVNLVDEKERLLALNMLKFPTVLVKTMEDLYPHHITDFCYELVNSVSDFYGACKVVGNELQNSRLLLLAAVRETLKTALGILGIDVAERL